MNHRDWLRRMSALTDRLKLYTHGSVTWSVDEEANIFFTFENTYHPKAGPLDPDQLGELGTDDAAHHVLAVSMLNRVAAFRSQ
jgi:hypothetical protein